MSGEDGNGGKLKANNTEIGRLQNLKPVVDPGIDGIPGDAGALAKLLLERAEAMAFLSQYKDQLSIRDLYAAIIGNKEKFGNSCPACASEIYADGHLAVPQDPYLNAEAKLAQFDAGPEEGGTDRRTEKAPYSGVAGTAGKGSETARGRPCYRIPTDSRSGGVLCRVLRCEGH